LGFTSFLLSYRLLGLYVVRRPVLVATRDVEAYTCLKASDIKLAYIPSGGVPADALTSVEQAVGSYSRMPLLKGQIVQSGHVSSRKEEIGLSADLPPETRGMFIPASAARAVGGLLKKGEKVDLICAAKGPAYGQTMVFRDVRVLEVVRDESSREFQGALVLLSPAECELVASSLENCNVYLSLVPRDSGAAFDTSLDGRRLP